ncbi:MAG: hypothetical protein ACREEB_07790 [Caulobacteraceae bacterium]
MVDRSATSLAACLAVVCAWPALASPPTGLRQGVIFNEYPPAAAASRLLARVVSPLTAWEMRSALAASGKALKERTLDLRQENFLVYIPPRAPPGGYGLLVFVPPWPSASLPEGWAPVLDRLGYIFVSAAGSGNEANVLTRREPLALVAEANVASLYPLDPARVFVGGFSGGAHVALRLALGFPDIFTGALLDAGADPIGDHAAPLPTIDLFEKFQTRSRLYLVTGSRDRARLAMDTDSLDSLSHWCVAGVVADQIPDAGHAVADPAALERALTVLQSPVRVDARRISACRAGVDRDLAKAEGDVERLLAAGRADEARKALIKLDARFGGLAAPMSVQLAEKLAGR